MTDSHSIVIQADTTSVDKMGVSLKTLATNGKEVEGVVKSLTGILTSFAGSQDKVTESTKRKTTAAGDEVAAAAKQQESSQKLVLTLTSQIRAMEAVQSAMLKDSEIRASSAVQRRLYNSLLATGNEIVANETIINAKKVEGLKQENAVLTATIIATNGLTDAERKAITAKAQHAIEIKNVTDAVKSAYVASQQATSAADSHVIAYNREIAASRTYQEQLGKEIIQLQKRELSGTGLSAGNKTLFAPIGQDPNVIRAHNAALSTMNGTVTSVAQSTSIMDKYSHQFMRTLVDLTPIISGLGLLTLAHGAIQATDQYTKLTSQLKIATNSTSEYAFAMSEVKRISSAAQVDIGAIGSLYQRLSLATQASGTSQKEVALITETVSLGLKANGASARESASAMLQLSQSFGSGRMAGEEFNSMAEAAPNVLRALAASMGVPYGALKQLASEGKITTEVMVKAFTDPALLAAFQAQAKSMRTITGSWTEVTNALVLYVGESSKSSGVVNVLSGALSFLADHLRGVADGVIILSTVMLVNLAKGFLESKLAIFVTNTELAINTKITLDAAKANLALAVSQNEVAAATSAVTVATEAHAAATLSMMGKIKGFASANALGIIGLALWGVYEIADHFGWIDKVSDKLGEFFHTQESRLKKLKGIAGGGETGDLMAKAIEEQARRESDRTAKEAARANYKTNKIDPSLVGTLAGTEAMLTKEIAKLDTYTDAEKKSSDSRYKGLLKTIETLEILKESQKSLLAGGKKDGSFLFSKDNLSEEQKRIVKIKEAASDFFRDMASMNKSNDLSLETQNKTTIQLRKTFEERIAEANKPKSVKAEKLPESQTALNAYNDKLTNQIDALIKGTEELNAAEKVAAAVSDGVAKAQKHVTVNQVEANQRKLDGLKIYAEWKKTEDENALAIAKSASASESKLAILIEELVTGTKLTEAKKKLIELTSNQAHAETKLTDAKFEAQRADLTKTAAAEVIANATEKRITDIKRETETLQRLIDKSKEVSGKVAFGADAYANMSADALHAEATRLRSTIPASTGLINVSTGAVSTDTALLEHKLISEKANKLDEAGNAKVTEAHAIANKKANDELEKAKDHLRQIGLNKEETATSNAAKFRLKAEQITESDMFATKQTWLDAAKVMEQAAIKENADKAKQEWKKVNDSIVKSFEDSFMKIFDKGHNMFKTLIDGIGKTVKDAFLKTTFDSVIKKPLEGIAGGFTEAISGLVKSPAMTAAMPYVAAAMMALPAIGGLFSHQASAAQLNSVNQQYIQQWQGTGTVLGDISAKSGSIAGAMDTLNKTTFGTNNYIIQMASSMKNVDKGLSAFITTAAKALNINIAGGMGITGGMQQNLSGGMNMLMSAGISTLITPIVTSALIASGIGAAAISAGVGAIANGAAAIGLGLSAATILSAGVGLILAPLIGDFLGGLFGSSSTSITGTGVNFGGTTKQLQQGQGGQQYTSGVTQSDSFFGLVSDTSVWTKYATLNSNVTKALGNIFSNIGNTIKVAATALGGNLLAISNAVDSFVINTGNVSLAGLNVQQQQDALSAIVSQQSDLMVGKVIPSMKAFQVAGEGLLQTLVRVVSEVGTMNAWYSLLGMTTKATTAAADAFVTTLGGVDTSSQLMTKFLQNFGTAGQQASAAFRSLDAVLVSIGLGTMTPLIRTTADYFNLMKLASSSQQVELLKYQDVALSYIQNIAKNINVAMELLSRTSNTLKSDMSYLQSNLSSLASTLKGAAMTAFNSLMNQSDPQYAMKQRRGALADLSAMYEQYKATGVAPNAALAQQKVTALGDVTSQTGYSSYNDWLRGSKKSIEILAGMGNLADTQLTIQQRMSTTLDTISTTMSDLLKAQQAGDASAAAAASARLQVLRTSQTWLQNVDSSVVQAAQNGTLNSTVLGGVITLTSGNQTIAINTLDKTISTTSLNNGGIVSNAINTTSLQQISTILGGTAAVDAAKLAQVQALVNVGSAINTTSLQQISTILGGTAAVDAAKLAQVQALLGVQTTVSTATGAIVGVNSSITGGLTTTVANIYDPSGTLNRSLTTITDPTGTLISGITNIYDPNGALVSSVTGLSAPDSALVTGLTGNGGITNALNGSSNISVITALTTMSANLTTYATNLDLLVKSMSTDLAVKQAAEMKLAATTELQTALARILPNQAFNAANVTMGARNATTGAYTASYNTGAYGALTANFNNLNQAQPTTSLTVAGQTALNAATSAAAASAAAASAARTAARNAAITAANAIVVPIINLQGTNVYGHMMALALKTRAIAAANAMPAFAQGTNYLPNDMVAKVHEGERIMPKADNTELMVRLRNPQQNNEVLIDEIRALRKEVIQLRQESQAGDVAIAQNTQKTAKIMDRWNGEGMPSERLAA